MKKWTIVAIIAAFVASAIPAFADVGPGSEKTIFQGAADNLTGFETWIKGEKSTYTRTPTGVFQEMSNYIEDKVKSSPNMRASSLRGNPGELARRRGQ
jgi:hypothetical protein